MSATRSTPVLIAAIALLGAPGLGACGDDEATPSDTSITTEAPATTEPAATTTTETTSTTEATTTTEAAATTTEVEATTTTTMTGLEQPAIWPAADVAFTTPEEAAADFVIQVLGVPPVLGEFMQGDSRSGEIEVYSPGEGADAARVVRGLLMLRQLGPDDGWFVIAAANEFAAITTPEALAAVPADELTVEGVARGFEANVNVQAMIAGDASAVLDTEITMGGSMETAEPYSVTLDLSGAAPGDVVMLLVRGGVGLETDPGEFGAIPVVIAA